MTFVPIRQLGDPVLRTPCNPVRDFRSTRVRGIISDLAETLDGFRRSHGFGRGISAPQIGHSDRIILVDCEYQGPLINPRIVRRSRATFQLWDDCFSFPDILVKVHRHLAVTVAFLDDEGRRRTVQARGDLSELLQHEIDHLDGILAIDRAIDSRHIILRSEYEKLALDKASFIL